MTAPPVGYPGPILTDESNAFASHTMRVRVPDILQQTLDANLEMHSAARDAVTALHEEIASGVVMQPLPERAPARLEYLTWQEAYHQRAGQTWHGTDWFFAETYAYRRLIDAVRYFETQVDPFLPIKKHEYDSDTHQAVFDAALNVKGARDERLHALLLAALWGNRADLSYAESRTHGSAVESDVLIDHRDAVIAHLAANRGTVHIVADNAGSELTTDLVLLDALLTDDWAEQAVLHVKYHPTFVSDATLTDVQSFIYACVRGQYGVQAQAMAMRLQRLAAQGRWLLQWEAYWNSPLLWWHMPLSIADELRAASLVIVKGDANYRRVVGDAYWPHETPLADVVGGYSMSLLCLRTLKSDPLVGLGPGVAETLEAVDKRWRWSGQRGIIQACLIP